MQKSTPDNTGVLFKTKGIKIIRQKTLLINGDAREPREHARVPILLR